MGGGGFGQEPGRPRLIDYILSLSGKPKPRICYLPTAGADSDAGVVRFYRQLGAERCIPSDLPLFQREPESPRDVLLRQDVIWVGGGNTANMLATWRVHGVDRALREAWEQGIILVASGLPAGYALDDGVGLHFVGGDPAEIIAESPTARAYRVEWVGDTVVETPIEPRYLGLE
ncbi:MAG TPA: Type 1 glutamine amidotransferase-like domain-containing protein [Chloroflexota bacterium]|nr:Type 1 glutamine amidotransferase-like domain-containing protein [Chloroflexota bacterium]